MPRFTNFSMFSYSKVSETRTTTLISTRFIEFNLKSSKSIDYDNRWERVNFPKFGIREREKLAPAKRAQKRSWP